MWRGSIPVTLDGQVNEGAGEPGSKQTPPGLAVCVCARACVRACVLVSVRVRACVRVCLC